MGKKKSAIVLPTTQRGPVTVCEKKKVNWRPVLAVAGVAAAVALVAAVAVFAYGWSWLREVGSETGMGPLELADSEAVQSDPRFGALSWASIYLFAVISLAVLATFAAPVAAPLACWRSAGKGRPDASAMRRGALAGCAASAVSWALVCLTGFLDNLSYRDLGISLEVLLFSFIPSLWMISFAQAVRDLERSKGRCGLLLAIGVLFLCNPVGGILLLCSRKKGRNNREENRQIG